MAPLVHLVRHAEGEHNKGGDAYFIRDPGLTERGLEECRNLSERFPYHSSIDLIVSSPLRRALHTALFSFQPAIARGIKIVALPELQETSDIVCDEGSEKSDLEREFADAKGPSGENVVDLGLLYEGWWVKKGKYAPTSSALIARARLARQWLRGLPAEEIAVVGHGGAFHYLTEDWTGIGNTEHASSWQNTEFRTYRFVDDTENATMVETDESRAMRGEAGRILSSEEQHSLYLKVMQFWENRGFQNPLKKEVQFKEQDRRLTT
ncbi:hypothetical protein VTN00DRAFT_9352 [Thermoascus crustaceus]|uniref:uncharacterized protein n=1 Tax=Thermoascus crustaceus TaxID=5088 RepID=UPI003744A948